MQVTEVSAEGLSREYKVVVPAEEIAGRVQSRLEKLSKTIRVPGFRPGKAPLTLLRKQYGRSVMGEVLEEALDEGSKKTIADHNLRPALRPKIEVTSFDEGKDLEFGMKLEVLPEVPAIDMESIELTRLVAEVDDERLRRSLETLAQTNRKYEPTPEPRPAQNDDQVVVDFVGKRDGETFQGGSAEDFVLLLGSNSMIPGFEAGIVGMMPGEQKVVAVTFPEDYPAENLKGRTVTFDVTLKEVRAPLPTAVDDALAKKMGLDDLKALEQALRERLEEEYKGVARARMKRQLLDHLAETYRFEVPPGMVDLEFEAIWRQLTEEMKRNDQTFEQLGEDEEKTKAEYRAIAERRVRLGLLLSDIGTKHDVKVESQELQQAVLREAMRFQGQERKVFEFYRNNPQALEHLRAPIFEDKVVDLIIERAKVTEQGVSVEKLLENPEEPPEVALQEPAATDSGEKSEPATRPPQPA